MLVIAPASQQRLHSLMPYHSCTGKAGSLLYHQTRQQLLLFADHSHRHALLYVAEQRCVAPREGLILLALHSQATQLRPGRVLQPILHGDSRS